jgi:ABC-type polysaccharide/polyol phosphate export permease
MMQRIPRQSLLVPSEWMGFTLYFARDNLTKQYQRTKLGPLWIVLTQFVLIFGIAIVFFSIFQRPLAEFLPFISAGLLTWGLIANPLTQAPTVFVAVAPVIQSFRLSYASFPLQLMINHLAIYFQGLVIHALVLLITGTTLLLIPLALPGLVLIQLIIYPLIAVIGLLGARYRDLTPAMASVMYMAFLVTPVIWEKPAIAKHLGFIVDFNPFFHMIEIVRQPLLGQLPSATSYLVCVALAGISLLAGEAFFQRYARPLVFWV